MSDNNTYFTPVYTQPDNSLPASIEDTHQCPGADCANPSHYADTTEENDHA